MKKLFLVSLIILTLFSCEEITNKRVLNLNKTGNSLYEKGNYKSAINNFKRAIQIDSTYSLSYYNLGLVYNQLKQYDSVIKYLDVYIKNDSVPKEKSHFLRGVSNYKLASLDLKYREWYYNESIKDFKMIIEKNPESSESYYYIGLCYDKLSNYELIHHITDVKLSSGWREKYRHIHDK